MAVADLGTHLVDQRTRDVGSRPIRAEPGEVVQKPAEYLLSVRGVHHFRVVLHPGQAPAPVLEGGHRGTRTAGHHVEPVRRGRDGVAMTHPDRLDIRQARMQFPAKDFQLRAAVFAGAGMGDGPAECLRHGLKSIADAEHRETKVEQRGIKLRSAVGIDTCRSAGKHDCQRITSLDLLDSGGVRDDLGKNPRFPHPAGDQLRVLRAEVDH